MRRGRSAEPRVAPTGVGPLSDQLGGGCDAHRKTLDSAPPSLILNLLIASLPAAFSAVSAAASWAITTLTPARRAALRDTLEGGSQRALDRYLESGPVIEARWLVIRTIGIAVSALLVGRQLPEWFGNWLPVLAAMNALFAYALPTEIARGL